MIWEVASFTDAWIETYQNDMVKMKILSHLLQMRGLKLCLLLAMMVRLLSHLLQMRGLKQYITGFDLDKMRRIFYRCVD